MNEQDLAAIEARVKHSSKTEWSVEELADDTFIYGKVGHYGFIAATCDSAYEAEMFVQALADREALLKALYDHE